MGVAYSRVGDVADERGDLGAAEHAFTHYLTSPEDSSHRPSRAAVSHIRINYPYTTPVDVNVALVGSGHNQMSWPRGDHTPQARDAVPSGRVARASASPDP